MGIDFEERRFLKRAALLHDIGKLGVSNSVLDNSGKLDDAEWVQMKRHSEFSEHILSKIGAFSSVAIIGGAHHERMDGKGYPRGLLAEDILMEVRIVSTEDVLRCPDGRSSPSGGYADRKGDRDIVGRCRPDA